MSVGSSYLSFQLFYDLGHIGVAKVHTRTYFVHHVDGFVGEAAVSYVAAGQSHTRLQGFVGIGHVVVFFVALLDVVENFERLFLCSWLHHNLLESAFQRTVLFYAVAVFVERCGTDALQLTSGKCWLHHVGCVHLSSLVASTYEGMYLINEDDYVFVVLEFGDDGLHSLLKLTAVLRSSHHTTHVESDQTFVAKHPRHPVFVDSARQSFYNRTLSYTRVTDKHGIVLLPAA